MTMRSAGSVADSCLIWIATTALMTAALTAIRVPALKPSGPGRTITSTPMKPSTTADQRRARTCSPSQKTANTVTNSGLDYDSDTACARGRWPIAQKPQNIDNVPSTQRTA